MDLPVDSLLRGALVGAPQEHGASAFVHGHPPRGPDPLETGSLARAC